MNAVPAPRSFPNRDAAAIYFAACLRARRAPTTFTGELRLENDRRYFVTDDGERFELAYWYTSADIFRILRTATPSFGRSQETFSLGTNYAVIDVRLSSGAFAVIVLDETLATQTLKILLSGSTPRLSTARVQSTASVQP